YFDCGFKGETAMVPIPNRTVSMIFWRSINIVIAWRTRLSLKNGRSLFQKIQADIGIEYLTFENCWSKVGPEVCSLYWIGCRRGCRSISPDFNAASAAV